MATSVISSGALPSTASPTTITSPSSKLKESSPRTSNPSSDDENPSSLERTMSGASTRSLRPRLGPRKPSGTMIVPADHPEVEIRSESYDQNDARSFSPRRTPEETEKMVGGKREALQSHANELQSGLNAIVEKIESIKTDHDKLARNNNALQDYIGGLTQSMSKTNLTTSTSGRKKL